MKLTPSIILCLTILSANAALAADANRFDGNWEMTISCANSMGAMGYAFKIPSQVKDSVFHGEKGEKDKAGWLQVDGKIKKDGSASLLADGLVGASEFAVGHRPAGTQYGYHIKANFTDTEGSGKRVEGRPCDVDFSKEQ